LSRHRGCLPLIAIMSPYHMNFYWGECYKLIGLSVYILLVFDTRRWHECRCLGLWDHSVCNCFRKVVPACSLGHAQLPRLPLFREVSSPRSRCERPWCEGGRHQIAQIWVPCDAHCPQLRVIVADRIVCNTFPRQFRRDNTGIALNCIMVQKAILFHYCVNVWYKPLLWWFAPDIKKRKSVLK